MFLSLASFVLRDSFFSSSSFFDVLEHDGIFQSLEEAFFEFEEGGL